MLNCGIIKS